MLLGLEFQPILKRSRWGGRRLGTLLNKPIGPESDYAESWEIADHGDDQSVVAGGPQVGATLRSLVEKHGGELLGTHAGRPRFPLLVKYLDAHDRLSVQVHPDDHRAARFDPGARGKTEAWVIVHADAGSRLFVGLKAGVDRRDFEHALRRGAVEECLHSFPVAAGDCVHVPAGTVHAIGEGIVLAEIQQTSDLTFRLYDWGRIGPDGQARPLHIDQALQCIDFDRGPLGKVEPTLVPVCGGHVEELVRNDYFVVRRHTSRAEIDFPAADRFRILMLLGGSGTLACGSERQRLDLGATRLIPASAPAARVIPDEEAIVIEAFAP